MEMQRVAFAQLAKYDETTGYFEAVAADESLDKADEIFDYDRSKPHFKAWSDNISKVTNGKSVGNVRAMHGKIAAGKLTDISFDDVAKSIRVCGLVVDPVEKAKMASGVYTGVSIGGSYVGKKWDDPVIKGAKRYEAKPSELSLVDLPCNDNAHFLVVKEGGIEELHKFVQKGLGTVGRLADILQQLAWVQDDAEWEAEYEGDKSAIPGELKEAVKNLGAILVRMTAEEVAEVSADDALEAAAKPTDLNKSQPSEEDKIMDKELEKLQAEHTAALAKLQGDHEELKKAHEQVVADLAKAVADVAERDDLMRKAAERMNSDAAIITANNAAIKALQSAPAAVRIAMNSHAVSKVEDTGNKPEEVVVKNADGSTNEAATEIKKALQNPLPV